MIINNNSKLNLYNKTFTGLKSNRKFFTKNSIEKIIVTSEMSESKKKKALRDNKVLDLLAEGLSKEKIAQMVGISFSTVKKIFEKYQVAKIASANRDKIILTRLKNGEKRESIAKDLSISIGTVNLIAEKNNIYRIKKKERTFELKVRSFCCFTRIH